MLRSVQTCARVPASGRTPRPGRRVRQGLSVPLWCRQWYAPPRVSCHLRDCGCAPRHDGPGMALGYFPRVACCPTLSPMCAARLASLSSRGDRTSCCHANRTGGKQPYLQPHPATSPRLCPLPPITPRLALPVARTHVASASLNVAVAGLPAAAAAVDTVGATSVLLQKGSERGPPGVGGRRC